MISVQTRAILIGGALIAALVRLSLGQLVIQNENDRDVGFFIKKTPMWRFTFENPYESMARGPEASYARRMDKDGRWLETSQEYRDLQDYCRARYSMNIKNNIKAEMACREAHQPNAVFFY